MDLSTALEAASPAVKKGASQQGSNSADSAMALADEPVENTQIIHDGPVSDPVLSRLRSELVNKPVIGVGSGGTHRSGMRQEKRVADSQQVVADAILKLNALVTEDA